jgi:ribosomal protein L11 methylase PrmA
VVAVCRLRLGFRPAVGADLDPEAVEAAEATARRTEVNVAVLQADVLRDLLPPSDVLVAIFELGVVEAVLLRAPARFSVTSGYLANEAPAVAGWERAARLELEGWAADVLVRL